MRELSIISRYARTASGKRADRSGSSVNEKRSILWPCCELYKRATLCLGEEAERVLKAKADILAAGGLWGSGGAPVNVT